ncbi:MAG: hypothetical protein NTX00_00050 [Candidatus Parcubacteria bacterium]|nr:hypothetical protein [Candidatus Parcubacteria bacterium]
MEEMEEKKCIICKRKGEDLKQLVADRNSYICPGCLEKFPGEVKKVIEKNK